MLLKGAASALLATLTLLAGAASPAAAGSAPTAVAERAGVALGQPSEGSHAHNDYEHERPLLDALEHGFTSVEADVWLVDGELRVAHDLKDARAGVTLESLYLAPLDRLVAGRGSSVYPGWDGSLQLLIDVKSDAETTYTAVEAELAKHPSLMTRYSHGQVKQGPVTAVISGNRALDTMKNLDVRFGFFDGRSADLGSGMPSSLMPLVSANWTQLFTWQGVGAMPTAEKAALEAYVQRAHAGGYKVRFWATADQAGDARAALWTELRNAGVDYINTDDLAGLQAFLGK